jgi:glycosyltransferase involved in cell wall biosynthesis
MIDSTEGKTASLDHNPSRRKIVIVAPGVPHPSEGASTVLFFHYIDGFRRAGFNILLALLLQSNDSSPEQLWEFQRAFPESSLFKTLLCHEEQFIISSRFTHRLQSRNLAELVKAVDIFQPDSVFCLDFQSAWAANRFDVPRKVVWLSDLNFHSYWYNSLYSWKEGTARPWHLVWSIAQTYSWRRLYGRVLQNFDKIIVSSKSSERALAKLDLKSSYLGYPWPNKGVSKARTKRKDELPTFLFFGTLVALGSRSAFRLLLNEVYPLAVREFGNNGFKIKICGRGEPSSWATTALQGKSEIEMLGFVDDLNPLFARCHALIAPIDVPVGNRSRIITAMANRLLVVAHQNTALGNPDLVDGETCYLAKTPLQFVQKMRSACHNPEINSVIEENAYRIYKNKFDPAAAVAALLKEAF